MKDRPSRPNDQFVSKLGIAAIAAVATVGAGAMAAEYAVSEINPIYYGGVPSRPLAPLSDSTTNYVSAARADEPQAQYYAYRVEPVRNVYGAYPTYSAPPQAPDFADPTNFDEGDDQPSPQVADEPLPANAAEEPPDTIGEGDRYGAERLPPPKQAHD